MTVAELIAFLKTQQQDLHVICDFCSDFELVVAADINVIEACAPRPDGIVARKRPDKPSQKYLSI